LTRKTHKGKDRKGATLPEKRWIALGIFILALCVRVIYIADSSDNPTFMTPIVDSQTYDGLARDLASGQPMSSDLFWQPVFYPWFLALIYWLGQGSILLAKIVQAVLGGATALLTFRIGENVFGRGVGILAGVIVAVYMPLVFFELELLAAGWAAFWMVAMVWSLLEIREKPLWRTCCVFGLAGALAIITRPVFSLFFGAACIWLVAVWMREKAGWAKIVPRVAGLALGFLLIAGPVWMVSHKVTGQARLLPYSGGINVHIGNNPDYEKTITIRPGLGWRELTSEPMRQGITSDQGMERFFWDKTREYARSAPGPFMMGMMTKAAQFLNSREMPRNTDIYLFGKWSRMLRWLVWKIGPFGFPFGLLLPLVLLEIVFHWRLLRGPLWLALVCYSASVIAVFVASRYRVPLVPVMSVLAAAGLWTLRDLGRNKQWKRLALASALVLAVAVACSVTGPFDEERLDYEAELHYGLGSTYDAHGEVEKAAAAYTRAIASRSDYAEAHYNLANIRKDQGRLAEAVEHYQQALQAAPDSVEIRTNYAAALRSQGKIEQAVEQWSRVLEIDRANPFAHYNLGSVHFERGDYEPAIRHFKQALRSRPDWVEVHHNLGVALGSMNRLDEAEEHFRHAVRLEAGSAAAHYNLGYALELQGKTEEAIAEYRRALEIDPGHTESRRRLDVLTKRCQAPFFPI
jgi:tetratricopeptide (TPR) repeat protein